LFVVKFCMPVVLKQWACNREVIDADLLHTVNSITGMLQIKLDCSICFVLSKTNVALSAKTALMLHHPLEAELF